MLSGLLYVHPYNNKYTNGLCICLQYACPYNNKYTMVLTPVSSMSGIEVTDGQVVRARVSVT